MLEEFKKAKYQDQGGTGSTKMSYYKEIEEIIRDRRMNNQYKSPTPSTAKVDSFMRFTDEGTSSLLYLRGWKMLASNLDQ
ncbi:hypothetical protein SAY87_005376 [Trapa incisa]|uniref:Uncharacterized protein n=1 Tax=Trapa incisa TaxID=236973 RepID=A0AAN7K2U0_9MYRT|nr:hypothetical protein SAY87_005376 [Trapa incisa]